MIKKETVCRLCRRLGMKLYLKGSKCYSEKCPFEKRPFPPGQHGRSRRMIKFSDYGIRLGEKQKLKNYYFMREEQFRRFFEMALKAKGNTATKFIELLERRLDNTVFRAGLARSKRHAKQIVSHGHVKINGKKVDIPSFIVKVGDEIEVEKEVIPQDINVRPAGWLEVNENKIRVIRLPERQDLPLKINENFVVEFYSR